jgi:hypothetical protein
MPAVRPRFHLTPCSKFRGHLSLSIRLEQNTKPSPQYGFLCNASLTSADSVYIDFRKSTRCDATTTLRSACSAIMRCPSAPTA